MDVPFFVAFSAILLVGKYLPLALPLNLRPALLAGNNAASSPARAAKCALSVAVGGLALLVAMQGSGAGAGPAGVAVMIEARVLWFNSAALFLGTLLGVAAVALHPPPARAPPFVQVAVDHLTVATEIIAINAFAHNLCVSFKIFKV